MIVLLFPLKNARLRKRCVFEAVEAPSSYETRQNTYERVLYFGKSHQSSLIRGKQLKDRLNVIRLQKHRDHKPGGKSCDRRRSIPLISHSYANAYRKQYRDIVDQRSARFYQEHTDHREYACHLAALHGSRTQQITDAHENAAERQTCHRQHDRFSKFLQVFHDLLLSEENALGMICYSIIIIRNSPLR